MPLIGPCLIIVKDFVWIASFAQELQIELIIMQASVNIPISDLMMVKR